MLLQSITILQVIVLKSILFIYKIQYNNPYLTANKTMKYSKQPSLSTDTRLSRSGIFNNSSLNNSNVPLQTKTVSNTNNNFYMSNNIHNCENKEIEFLRIKNAQLQEKNRRLTAQIKQLQNNKNQILGINSKYVDVVNRYYECQNKRGQKQKGQSSTGTNFRQTKDILNMSNSQAHRVLQQLQKDHRNLVKHCLVMQQQIKNYTKEMQKFEIMKNQLKSVNHTTVDDLIQQIEDLTEQNKNLRKNNNQITYELEKFKEQCKKVKKLQSARQKQAGDGASQIAKMRSIINTTQQQSVDKSNAYQARIYQLQLKVQRLEKQLRQGQQSVLKTHNLHKDLQIKQVEHVHNYQKLQKNLSDLLKSRQRANSLYSRGKSNNRNGLQISINNALQRHKNSVNYSRNFAKNHNQRKSLAEKHNIIL